LEETDAQQQPYWAQLQEIALPARERRRLPPEVRSRIIVNLCRVAPLSVKDLSILLDRSEAYVGDAIRPLVTTGALTFLYPDQPRHPRQKYGAGVGDHPIESPVSDPEDIEVIMDEPPIRLRPEIADSPRPSITRAPQDAARPATRIAAPVEPPPPELPNQATNLAFVTVLGAILGLIGTPWWWVVAIVAALFLSGLHIARGSAQYRQFTSLRFLRNKPSGFMALKSVVAFVEIAVVYLIIRLVLGSD
jgi:hypothetical protein